jgi:hypothetical protein
LQKIAFSGDQGSTDWSPTEHKSRCSGSLIDFNPDSKPIDAETIPQTQQVPHSDNGGYWASFEHPAKEKVQAPSENTLESLLFELSVPSVVPASNNVSEQPNNDALSPATGDNIPAGGFSLAASVQQMSALPTSASGSTTVSTSNNMALVPSVGGPLQATDSGICDSAIKIPYKQELSNMQQCHPNASPIADCTPIMQQMSPTFGTQSYQVRHMMRPVLYFQYSWSNLM